MTRTATYNRLKAFGHSPAKALEIAIDVERGDSFAIEWLMHLPEENHSRCFHCGAHADECKCDGGLSR